MCTLHVTTPAQTEDGRSQQDIIFLDVKRTPNGKPNGFHNGPGNVLHRNSKAKIDQDFDTKNHHHHYHLEESSAHVDATFEKTRPETRQHVAVRLSFIPLIFFGCLFP
jgi:hypothetical protein